MYFHGNAEDIGYSQEFLEYLVTSLKINVLAIEYPSYGIYAEEGGCSDKKIKEDAEYMYLYVKQETGLEDKDIMIFGRSIGTGPAVHLAARHQVGLLALMSAYTSIRDIAKF